MRIESSFFEENKYRNYYEGYTSMHLSYNDYPTEGDAVKSLYVGGKMNRYTMEILNYTV